MPGPRAQFFKQMPGCIPGEMVTLRIDSLLSFMHGHVSRLRSNFLNLVKVIKTNVTRRQCHGSTTVMSNIVDDLLLEGVRQDRS